MKILRSIFEPSNHSAEGLATGSAAEQTDENLMSEYGKGHYQAFTLLYQRHKDPLYRYFLKLGASPSQAEECAHDTWHKVIKNRQTYRIEAKFTTWLYKIARNLWLDQVKKPQLTLVENVSDDDEISNPSDSVMCPIDESLKVQALRHCLDKLNFQHREIFLLKIDAGLSIPDISQVIETNIEACKSRLRIAVTNLTICVKKQISDDTEEMGNGISE